MELKLGGSFEEYSNCILSKPTNLDNLLKNTNLEVKHLIHDFYELDKYINLDSTDIIKEYEKIRDFLNNYIIEIEQTLDSNNNSKYTENIELIRDFLIYMESKDASNFEEIEKSSLREIIKDNIYKFLGQDFQFLENYLNGMYFEEEQVNSIKVGIRKKLYNISFLLKCIKDNK